MRFYFKLGLFIIFILGFLGGLGSARSLPRPAHREDLALKKATATAEEDRVPGLLLDALQAGGARLDTVTLEAWAVVNGAFVDAGALHEMARQAAAALGVDGDKGTNFTAQDGEGFHAVYWQGEVQPRTAMFFSLQSLSGSGGEGETYLLINVSGRPREGEREIHAWLAKMRAAFSPWQAEPRLTYTMTGFVPGRLASTERERRAEKILKTLEAQKVEGIEDGELLSVSAYTSRLPDFLEVAGRKVNVNVALRYHAVEGKTYIYLGCPLLGGEY
ncbi:YwmB family TATA-box binding protein [Neomoorella humiferrea]|uniref:YwmB family TATA-box binding protein n=1 Tax=Neomoorella humiferrea TaxID=676965 RepID=UPI003D9222A9